MKKSGNPVLAVLTVVLLACAASVLMQPAHAVESAVNHVDARRSFYLTKGAFTGGQALTACAAGYHMASIWEIRETAFLRYNASLGRSNGDSVYGGPPIALGEDLTGFGWLRIGTSTANCQNWTSSSHSDVGTFGTLTVFQNQPVWAVASPTEAIPCDGVGSDGTQANAGVWCVQN